ncbi:MAG: 3-deoxy-manno-octulosonate cytidylyltransferase [Patescibacteria group bacterium]
MNIVGIIPARMAAIRFPNKPLATIQDIPMVGHVYFRSKMAKSLNDVYVATCDKEIADYVRSIGGKAVMTKNTHEDAIDRTAEALANIEKETGTHIDFAALIQGDEPMLHPDMVDEMIQPVKNDSSLQVVNLIQKAVSEEEFQSPNTVKLSLDLASNILYFTRVPIPSRAKFKGEIPMWKQLGMMTFRNDALRAYASLPRTPLEIIEGVGMLRFIENGIHIKAAVTEYRTHSVDTPEDLKEVEDLMKSDTLIASYSS